MTNSWGYLFHWTEIIRILPDINLQVNFCPTELYKAQLIRAQHETERIPSNLFYLFPSVKDFPCGSVGKEPARNAGHLGLIPGLGRSPGGGHGNPLYSCPENRHEQRSLVGCSPWGCKESDMIEWRSTQCCVSFRWTARRLSHTYTCIHWYCYIIIFTDIHSLH